jgi:hypothetical protein
MEFMVRTRAWFTKSAWFSKLPWTASILPLFGGQGTGPLLFSIAHVISYGCSGQANPKPEHTTPTRCKNNVMTYSRTRY